MVAGILFLNVHAKPYSGRFPPHATASMFHNCSFSDTDLWENYVKKDERHVTEELVQRQMMKLIALLSVREEQTSECILPLYEYRIVFGLAQCCTAIGMEGNATTKWMSLLFRSGSVFESQPDDQLCYLNYSWRSSMLPGKFRSNASKPGHGAVFFRFLCQCIIQYFHSSVTLPGWLKLGLSSKQARPSLSQSSLYFAV